jgi:hypothetical protein
VRSSDRVDADADADADAAGCSFRTVGVRPQDGLAWLLRRRRAIARLERPDVGRHRQGDRPAGAMREMAGVPDSAQSRAGADRIDLLVATRKQVSDGGADCWI